jgi:long-subunit acyl-CoA synthetase (AMP-forming)
MFYSGGRIGIYNGDFKDLSRDLPILQPTIMICVPRILNRIYNRVNILHI